MVCGRTRPKNKEIFTLCVISNTYVDRQLERERKLSQQSQSEDFLIEDLDTGKLDHLTVIQHPNKKFFFLHVGGVSINIARHRPL